MKIGTKISTEDKSVEFNENTILMTFDSYKSVEIVINALQEIKNYLIKK